MNKKPAVFLKGIYRLFKVIAILGILLVLVWLVGQFFYFHGRGSVQAKEVRAEQATDEFFLYSPIILRGYPPETVFGVIMNSIREGSKLDLLDETDTKWARGGGVAWSYVEPIEGERNWEVLEDNAMQWQTAAEHGLTNIVIVGNTPSWAQKVEGHSCGAIKEDKLEVFADFMYELVDRYSDFPYHVKYWEIWNEPDVDPTKVKPDSAFGCWGDKNDPYYGGGYYAEMLKVVYPKIKAADPKAKVLVGGLLLDCDPNNPPSGKDCTPAKFLEGILMNGGAPYFDGVSHHAYEYYNLEACPAELGRYCAPNWDSAWNTTGPIVIAKARFLKSVLEDKGVSDKFLINTESALLCDACADDAEFETTKAHYVAQAYAAAIAEGLEANLWYSFSGWRNSGLIDTNGAPLPAYDAYKFAASELVSTQLLREITEYPGVKGYVFHREDRKIWVLWSLDGSDHVISLPGVPLASYDVDGDPLGVDSTLVVTLEPVYLEWSP